MTTSQINSKRRVKNGNDAESALRNQALNNAGSIVNVDEIMKIQRLRKEAAKVTNGKHIPGQPDKQAVSVAHHEERAMPAKVFLAAQRNLTEIPHRNEGSGNAPESLKVQRQEYI